MARERWRPVPGFESVYAVSDRGRVRRTSTGRILQPFERRGYLRVHLRNGDRDRWADVHLIVCEAFHGPRPAADFHASHEDGNRQNNRARNLSWKTIPENMADKVRHGTSAKGERNPCAKLTIRKAKALKTCDPERLPILAKRYRIALAHAKRVRSGECWQHVG